MMNKDKYRIEHEGKRGTVLSEENDVLKVHMDTGEIVEIPEEEVQIVRMRRVVLESPFAGDFDANIEYARRCITDCLKRGEAALASHLLYTQEGILDDTIPEERKLGIEAGFAWNTSAEAIVVYTDRGISKGMKKGIELGEAHGIPIEYRKLDQ